MPIRDSVRNFQKKLAKESGNGVKSAKPSKVKRTNTEHFQQAKEQAVS
jgi:hypothetical protein